MKDCQIPGGATLWARQTIDSEIFEDKPDKWFKIWFYLVNRVSHKDSKRYKRGETFYHQDWILEKTKASPDQLKKCLAWLRDRGMISTRRSTRGTWLKIPRYNYFQTLDNYYYKIEAPEKARKKHERSTKEAPRYNKNDKNDKKKQEMDSLCSSSVFLDSKNLKNKPATKKTPREFLNARRAELGKPPMSKKKPTDKQQIFLDVDKLGNFYLEEVQRVHGEYPSFDYAKSGKNYKMAEKRLKEYGVDKCKSFITAHLMSDTELGIDFSICLSSHVINKTLINNKNQKPNDLKERW